MTKVSKMVKKVALIIMAFIFFFLSSFVLPCQKCDVSQTKHCCCESCLTSQPTKTQEKECSCEIKEWPEPQSSPAVIIPDYNIKPESVLQTSEVEVFHEDSFTQPKATNSHLFILLNRDPPLYLLNSSFLI